MIRPRLALRFAAFVLVTLSFAGASFASVHADELVMFQQDGCPYCARWNADVGKIYAKTDEAKEFPLRRVDIHAARPADLESIEGIRYTPTFVVIHCGHEVARILGYETPESFWEQLDAAKQTISESKSNCE